MFYGAKKMNISVIGYGKMGHEIERIAVARGISVKSVIDTSDADAAYKEIDEKSMSDVDVCIDFTRPDAVVNNIKNISKFKKNIVVGTTGWYSHIDEVKGIVEKAQTGLIYAPNFSVGVNVFFRIVESAARIIDRIDAYDVHGYEMHHSKKLDSPSGTAKAIEEILVKNIRRKTSVPFASIRSGSIPGTHAVGFDSSSDTIELKHVARNREGFALGAIMAAEWINNRKGFYTVNDMMNDILGDNNV